MTDERNPYLFPVPASVLRSLLNVKAQSGKPFSEDEATADLMLDRDHLAAGRKPPRQNGELHTYDTYAARWGWGKATVYRAFKGDAHRNVRPWIGERVESWRRFFQPPSEAPGGAPDGNAGDRGGNIGDQKTPETPPPERIGDRGGTIGDRGGTYNEQTPRPTEHPPPPAHARGGPGRGGPFDHPAVLEYERIVGKGVALEHARIIAAAVPDDPDAVARFAVVTVTWRDTPRWNERNVPDLLQHFARHERERSNDARNGAHDGRAPAHRRGGGRPVGAPSPARSGAADEELDALIRR